ncbi:hypothetical protein ABZY19_35620 [Streptomyces sp. NPDC006475]|uniref:hypothetical protein n=1 Tax=Streptomyces sp. NPDC006475 TaxID=3155719 RepID=UPI0033AA6B89
MSFRATRSGWSTKDERLFDITEIAKAECRGQKRSGLPLIVSYGGPGSTTARTQATDELKAELREDADAVRTLSRLDAEAGTVPSGSIAAVWDTLTVVVVDIQGNTLDQTIRDAYRGK